MLKIIKSESDGHTGHITVHAQVMEQDGNASTLGATETHGIAAQQLQESYNGDPHEWLRSVHRGMLERHAARKTAATALKSLHGLTVFTDEDSENGNQAPPA